MISPDSAVLDVDSQTTIDIGSTETLDSASAASQLQFQDFPRSQPTVSKSVPQTASSFNHSIADDSNVGDGDEEDVLIRTAKAKANSLPFWELAYFAKYFDVTTQDVMSRIMWSVLPLPSSKGLKPGAGGNYIERHIQTNPDLYGPLWINVTLIFTIAICGNIANYLSSNGDMEWHYDFNKVGLAASTVMTYTLGVPTALWFFFWFRGCSSMYTLLETVCAYGYSLSVYIPISLFWMFGITIVQYVLVIVGALLSGSVLVLSFAPVVQSDPSKTVKLSYILLLLIITMHSLVAFTFLAYFF
jgi:hypothetical protein